MTGQSIPTVNHYVALIKLKSLNDSLAFIEEVAQEIINDLDLKVVKKISHLFHPRGVTLAYILSESHLLIHTWPESNIVHIDLVTCSYRGIKEFENSINSAFPKEDIDSIDIMPVDFNKLSDLE